MAIKPKTLLLYALVKAENGVIYWGATNCGHKLALWWNLADYIVSKRFDETELPSLIEHIRAGQNYTTSSVHFFFSNEHVCVLDEGRTKALKRDIIISDEPQVFLSSLEKLQARYEFCLHNGIDLDHGFLRYVGDSDEMRRFLLQTLARAQEVEEGELKACWDTFIFCAIHYVSYPGRLIALANDLQSGWDEYQKDEDYNWHEGGHGEYFSWFSNKDRLTLQHVTSEGLATCDVQQFVVQLLSLLIRYENALAS